MAKKRRRRRGLCLAVLLIALIGAVWAPPAAGTAVCQGANTFADPGPSDRGGGTSGHRGGGSGSGDCRQDDGATPSPAPSSIDPTAGAAAPRPHRPPTAGTGDAPRTAGPRPAPRTSEPAEPAAPPPTDASSRPGSPARPAAAGSHDVSAGVVALSISAIGALSALVGAGFGVRNRLRRLR